jgi:hypothetical protein
MRAFRPVLVALSLLLLMPTGATAAQRWSSPAATRTSGPCLSVDPCRLDQAIAGAASGDEVVLASGAYAVDAPLEPRVRLTLRGARGPQRPVLTGSAGLLSSVVTFRTGGTLRHVEIRATAPDEDALTIEGGVAEDVVLSSVAGDAAKVVTAAGGTVLRDAIASTDATASGAAALKIRTSSAPGEVMLRNVTALAPAATGIRCESSATLVNTVARGGTADVDASKSGGCSAAYSNYRPALSPGVIAGAGNQEAEPVLGADHRPAAGSPTIDAGTADPLLGATDPAGCPRTLGAAPDIGAYEFADAPCSASAPEVPGAPDTPAPAPPSPETSTDVPAGVPAPVQGTTVVVAPGQGKVLVRKPGTKRFRTLAEGTSVPVGSEIDSRLGRVRLVSAVTGGLQAGTFWGGRFVVRQRRAGDGMTSLVLRGGSFRQCRRTANAASFPLALASGKRKPIRRLWSRDRDGRFRTHGRNSVATARGTEWVTEERCDGTLTRVFEGAVSVRDRVKKRTKLVRAGRSYVARRR